MDKYNARWTMILAPKGKTQWAVTTSSKRTWYSVSKEVVDSDPAWRRHEDKHKEQYRREGWLKFVVKYLYYQIKYGYYNNPYEVEARAAE